MTIAERLAPYGVRAIPNLPATHMHTLFRLSAIELGTQLRPGLGWGWHLPKKHQFKKGD